MIDKELSELKNDIPNIDIKDFKSGVYKKHSSRQKRNKTFWDYRLALICSLVLMLLFSGLIIKNKFINDPIDEKSELYASNDKKFYANKFDVNNFEGSDETIAGPYETSFLEYDKSWYKVKVNPINEYVCLYLDGKVYEEIMEVVFHECCTFYTKDEDGKKFVFCDFIGIEKLNIEDIQKVDGSFANLYFKLLLGIRAFYVDDEYLNLQEYLNYIGSSIVISEENFIVKNSKDIDNLPIQNENYIAMAYFYYQEFDYLYNYVTKEEISKTVPYYGSMIAYENVSKNIYHNLLSNSKEYLLMDVPLEVRGGCCEFFEDSKYNYTGKKEFIAFEINNINDTEYVCLDENSDIQTITLLSQGDNYDVLFKEIVTTLGKEYYSINELLKVNKVIIEQWKIIVDYNGKQYNSSLEKLRSIVPNKLADEFKVATIFNSSTYDFEIDTITSGMVIYETISEVTSMEPPLIKVGFNYFNKTSVIIDQFNVVFSLRVYGKDIDEVKDLISAKWVNDDGVNKLVIIYDDSLIGEKLRIRCLYENQKYYHQYTSFLGATIDCYTNCALSEYVSVYLG